MAEYIKRESAIEAIMSDPPDAHYQSWYAEKINEIPAADVDDIVRCRGCIGRGTWYNDAEYGCAVCGMSGMYPKSENGYCSYGLRRSDE